MPAAMERPKARNQKAGRNAKKSKTRNKVPCEVEEMCEENCDTKSYRIYANPKGEGYAVEERFRRAGENNTVDEKKVMVTKGSNSMEIFEETEVKKHIHSKEAKKCTKVKEKSK